VEVRANKIKATERRGLGMDLHHYGVERHRASKHDEAVPPNFVGRASEMIPRNYLEAWEP
jgi:hypothetical protein